MFQWFKKQYETEDIGKIYNIVVSQSRRPELFAEFSVADTLDGRFDLLSLHMCLIFKRLKLEDNSHNNSLNHCSISCFKIWIGHYEKLA